jgi:hypothetical protein
VKFLPLIIASAVLSPCCFAQTSPKSTRVSGQHSQAKKPETSHLVFVTEYIRELAAIENIRASGEKELKQGTTDETFTNMIHSSTLFQLELGSQISMLKGMNLKSPFEDLIPNIITFYERKMELWKRMTDIGSAFIGGPKQGVDYSQLGAEMPQVRAKLEYIDHALFDVSPMIFATLIDMKPDSQNHASHLIITKAEREKLIADITNDFGPKLDEKDQNFTVSAASVLKTYLLKDYKCSDDPWD